MTKQELNCVLTIIDLCESYSAELYEEKGINNAVDTRVLKQNLLKAFDNSEEE